MEKLPNVIHKSWYPHLEPLFQSNGMKFIKNNILSKCKFSPSAKNIFNVFSMPITDIKVVVLGQDPYPTPGDAIGYAFAVSESTRKPPSLRIIEKEVGHELERTLSSWREQGVFLLNTALTVENKSAGSHIKYWQGFTFHVIRTISYEITPIWLLWGKYAQSFEPVIRDSERFLFNDILTAPHPAAEIYSGGKAGFLGCNHFNKVNEILENKHIRVINF